MRARQLTLPLGVRRSTRIVNVASVRHLSPFRYPGGKTWFVPRIRAWLTSIERPGRFIEPFAGGAIVGLTVAFETLADQVTLVELDDQIAAVWKTVIYGEAQNLAECIVNFELTSQSVDRELEQPAHDLGHKAFQTILKNRVNHGGILAPGAGRIKYGEGGKGIKSRWYPETLYKRIMKIAAMRERLSFVEGDGLEIIRQNSQRADTVFFVDPPYTAGSKKAGRRLYTHSEIDHAELFHLVNSVQGDFLMTYDNDAAVQSLADEYGFDTEPIAMKNTHHAKMTELVIGRDLGWMRE